MKQALNDFTSIQTGLWATPVPKGDVVYLQAKHFDESGRVRSILYPDLKATSITDKHLLKHGDVLFAAKGTKNFATVFEPQNPATVASTSFFVIRITDTIILSEFLVWFLNHATTQKFLKAEAIGTSIVSISKAVLEKLEVPIPSIETQKAILQIARLRNTEKELNQKIEALREKQIQQQITNAIK